MSIYDLISLASDSPASTHKIAKNLTKTFFPFPVTVLLKGEMGAGKTTFAQGLAEGLGLQDQITSPTFALENRYADRLSHIDLYRLSETEAAAFVHHLPPFSGIRLIEWPSRAGDDAFKDDRHLIIHLEETTESHRAITMDFRDAPVPPPELREQWKKEVGIAPHIIDHMNQVTHVAMVCADRLIQNGQPVRKEALRAAGELHDLLRFVDFKAGNGPDEAVDERQQEKWRQLKNTYGDVHEKAAAAFLTERGYAEIAHIVVSHGSPDHGHIPTTIEQKILTYSDKRVRHNEIVTVDERFDDFAVRYCKGKESDFGRNWRESVKRLEKELFGDRAPL